MNPFVGDEFRELGHPLFAEDFQLAQGLHGEDS